MNSQLAALLLLLLLLTGCVDVKYTQTFDRSGSSYIIQEVNTTLLSKTAGSIDQRELQEACDEVAPGISCSFEKGILKIGANFLPGENSYSFRSDNGFPIARYEADISHFPDFNSSGMQSSSSVTSQFGQNRRFDDPALSMISARMRSSGVKMTYVVEMPGEIIEAEGGEIRGNRAYFDVLSLLEGQGAIRVVSRELNYVYIALGLIILLIAYRLLRVSFIRPPSEPMRRSGGIFAQKIDGQEIRYVGR